jgi:hypothetical protein
MMPLKLGKKPFVPDARDLKLSKYLPKLPTVPAEFGNENLVTDWGMLGNDQVGDCTCAGSAHETMLWTAMGQGRPIPFTTEGVLADYSAITGYDPSKPESDQGATIRDVLKYRQKVGMVDAKGNRHKIGAFVSIDPKNLVHVYTALYLLEAVPIGVLVPSTFMSQFAKHQPWTIAPRAKIEGGHYVPLVGKRKISPKGFFQRLFNGSRNCLVCVTWAQLQAITIPAFLKYCDEAWGVISEEMLVNGKSQEGFDLDTLRADLAAVQA